MQFEGHQHPCHGAEADSHGLAVQKTTETLLLLLYMWSMPLVADRPGFPVLAQRRSPMVQTCSGPQCFLDARHGGQCPCCTGRAVHPVVAQRLCLTVQTVVGPRDSPVA